MTKKQLYFVIAVLCVVLLYMLFVPSAEVDAPELVPQEQEEDMHVVVDETPALESVAQESVELEQSEEPMVLAGTFVGLLDGENAYQKKFKYLLLNDGEEVLRIDLRPLVGYSDINIVEKLGVDRGDEIRATGILREGEFFVESIE